MHNLVIMESPAKANTVKNYLGSSYKVVASKGHIRDLPKSSMGVDIADGFKAHYINIRGKGELINELKKDVKKADRVYLATDPDREGEAIAWHLVNTLEIPKEKVKRVTFNAVTKNVVKDAIKNPRDIDMNIVDAQQARRILDRIIGYELSPYLWKKVKSGLSAGRVQSAATKIIVDRENEIRAFIPKEYWSIDVELISSDGKHFIAKFIGRADKGDKLDINNEKEAKAICSAIDGKDFYVNDIKSGKKLKNPQPPFITSTLQQEASRKLNFQSQKTMRIAQELYEGINIGSENGGSHGLITYMRTDSLRISEEAQTAARDFIINKLGKEYYPQTPRIYKTKSNAQDAHEAIRPATEMYEPSSIKKYLTPDQYKIYKLIWDRFIASQMSSAVLLTNQIDLTCEGYLFRASGYTVNFPGYMSVYEESADDEKEEDKQTKIPEAEKGQWLKQSKLNPAQHYTSPPARFTEAALVKFLEEKGIGRPSTYATIITTIISREYVKRDGKSLVPTNLGEITTKLMSTSFPDIVDYKFTAQLENGLDDIETGNRSMISLLNEFYGDFKNELDKAMDDKTTENIEVPPEETDMICEFCGSKMIVKNGKFGKFAACPRYPECKNTKPLVKKETKTVKEQDVKTDMKCEKCGADMVLRSGRFGSFYACSRYPECKFTKQISKEIGVRCPVCGGQIVLKNGKNKSVFYSCSNYPKCDFSSWDMPTNEKCPNCGGMLYIKKGKNYLYCKNEKCKFKKEQQEKNSNEQ